MKIEPNMYVRTIDGIIAKVVDNQDDEIVRTDDNTTHLRCYIKKASYNIIDLIEVGDYVNGYLIDYINLTCETPFLRSERPYRVDNTLYSTLKEKGRDYNQILHFYNEDIETIVTKEQMEAIQYVVK